MYEYKERTPAPYIVEFYTYTQRGYRIVRISLANPRNPRIMAFNDFNGKRTPAILYMTEIKSLLSRAKRTLFGDF